MAYQNKALNPILFRIDMLRRLPSIVFWGVKLAALDENGCTVIIPYSWRTQNPFKSIYFAALAGAAELSTGALCQRMLADRTPHSMLVLEFRAEYFKKANTEISFVCSQGHELVALLDTLNQPGDTGLLTMVSKGYNTSNELVARVHITWSFKRK